MSIDFELAKFEIVELEYAGYGCRCAPTSSVSWSWSTLAMAVVALPLSLHASRMQAI